MTTAVQTTKLTKAGERTAAQVLARAFWDDPLTVYVLPDESSRMGRLEWFFGVALRYGLRWGEVETTAGANDGNAIWLPPGATKTSVINLARVGLLAAPFRMGFGPFQRFMKFMNHFEHLHDRDAPERHWYLFILGVDPPRQGKGVGSALIAPVLARADAEHLPCYLETTKTKNVPFYQKQGFEVVVEDDLPGGGVHYWTMKRAARRPPPAAAPLSHRGLRWRNPQSAPAGSRRA